MDSANFVVDYTEFDILHMTCSGIGCDAAAVTSGMAVGKALVRYL